MELRRLGVKFFVADPAPIRIEDFTHVFHGWIQKQSVPGHLLIDVHDYSHLHQGPGILLVAHEGNFSMDLSHGRPGLYYYRKTPTALSPVEHVTAILQSALGACGLLEKDPGIHFNTDEFLIIANDRLEAPNDEQSFSELQPVLSAALTNVFYHSLLKLSRVNSDPRERLTVLVQQEQEMEKGT
jgi:hypothetical protein